MANSQRGSVRIVIADDDEDFPRLVQEAFSVIGVDNEIRWVQDGEQLLDYLLRQGKYEKAEDSPRPSVVFLDLNMPRKSGLEALAEIRATPDLRGVPIIIVSISNNPKDILRSYHLGANSYVTKPFDFDGLVDSLKSLEQYWFQTAKLPESF